MNEIELDLNLEGFKVGAQLATVKIKKDGSLEYSSMPVIDSWDERHKLWRTKRGFSISVDGKGYYFMSKNRKRGIADFYLSANSVHVKAAKAQAVERKKARNQKEKLDNTRFNEFEQKLDSLLAEYGAEIGAEQLSGDDQGVEVGWYISMGNLNKEKN